MAVSAIDQIAGNYDSANIDYAILQGSCSGNPAALDRKKLIGFNMDVLVHLGSPKTGTTSLQIRMLKRSPRAM